MSEEQTNTDALRKKIQTIYKMNNVQEIQQEINQILSQYTRNADLQNSKFFELNSNKNVFIGQDDYKKNRYSILFDSFTGHEQVTNVKLEEFELQDFDIENIEDMELQADLLEVDADIDIQLKRNENLSNEQLSE